MLNLIVTWLIKEFDAFYGTHSFITLFKGAFHWYYPEWDEFGSYITFLYTCTPTHAYTHAYTHASIHKNIFLPLCLVFQVLFCLGETNQVSIP